MCNYAEIIAEYGGGIVTIDQLFDVVLVSPDASREELNNAISSTILGSDNGLSPGRQAIIWTNAGILLIGHVWAIFSEILMGIHISSSQKMHLITSSMKWQPFLSASIW